MAIIQSHATTLSQNFGNQKLKLVPMTDEHLPILYEWNQMSDVLYWNDTEADETTVSSPASVDSIYGSVSKSAYMFIITLDDIPIGDCWLQDLNYDELIAKHPNKNAKRIDLTIFDKSLWGKGLGTAIFSMLLEFGFVQLNVDLIYGIIGDYNVRSQKCAIKCGLELDEILEHDETPKGKAEYCYLITKEMYIGG